MSATPQDVLMEAARILMRDGWMQGRAGGPTGPNCVRGAVRRATPEADPEMHWVACQRLAEVIGTGALAMWNDAPERTAEDVILALKRAASES